MRFRILGTPHLENTPGCGGRRVTLIAAMLAANVNKTVSLDRLIDAIWESSPPMTAREQVQNCVSLLRRRLARTPDDISITRWGLGYRLNANPYTVDARRFEGEVAVATELVAGNRPEAAKETLRRALNLWSGPALDGLEPVELRAYANRLDEMRMRATEQLIQLEIQTGRHDEAIAELRSLTRLHPLRESYMMLLTDALMHSGRQSEALAAYRTYADLLMTEMGAGPGPDAQARELEILQALDQPMSLPVSTDHRQSSQTNPVTLGPGDVAGSNRTETELLHHLNTAVSHLQAAFRLVGQAQHPGPGHRPEPEPEPSNVIGETPVAPAFHQPLM
ncbi:hypothetical protein GCM10027290_21080 [Micromonospora sonneratiae]|uniref:BTAD domain-containing putative transcriptional regulator n=1 Tax=Micromonospora sonneratiae TaxID=1184706 RepID=A0ABW3YHI6_9ACTN